MLLCFLSLPLWLREAQWLMMGGRGIEALCEENVVEWLTPFVLTKSKQSTTDTDQP